MRFLDAHRVPSFVQNAPFFKDMLWRAPSVEKTLYLTFDDGPVPEATPFVLDCLEKHSAKATFFCVGDNIRKHPEIFKRLLEQGHRIGNHTFNHLNAFKNPPGVYEKNIRLCQDEIERYSKKEKRPLFRPPYGKINLKQARRLSASYQIVMWEVLTGDFSPRISPRECLEGAIRHTRPGSIVVFHDSLKALGKLRVVLPEYLRCFSEAGYGFGVL